MGGHLYFRSDGLWQVSKMGEKKKRTWRAISAILLIVICLACAIEGTLTFRIYREYERLAKEKGDIESENATLKKQAADLQDTLGALQDELSALQVELARRQEEPGHLGETTQTEAEEMVVAEGISEELPDGTADVWQYFSRRDIVVGDAVYQRIFGKSYVENDDISLSDLQYLTVLHYNFAHEVQEGELIVNREISEDVLQIFRELFDIEYEIASMRLIDDYWVGDGNASDTASIDANNTSAFCYRTVTGGSSLSNHAFGRAIDINPQQNPYVWHEGGQLRWVHDNASPYIDRASGDPHVIVYGDACYSIFEKYGFSWGGNWSDPIDYQHFEKEGE